MSSPKRKSIGTPNIISGAAPSLSLKRQRLAKILRSNGAHKNQAPPLGNGTLTSMSPEEKQQIAGDINVTPSPHLFLNSIGGFPTPMLMNSNIGGETQSPPRQQDDLVATSTQTRSAEVVDDDDDDDDDDDEQDENEKGSSEDDEQDENAKGSSEVNEQDENEQDDNSTDTVDLLRAAAGSVRNQDEPPAEETASAPSHGTVPPELTDPSFNGVGMTFPTWKACDRRTPCSIASDADWLLFILKRPHHLFFRLRPPLGEYQLRLHTPFSRIWNNDSSRAALVSKCEEFQPCPRHSSSPASHPVPMTGMPNLVFGEVKVGPFPLVLSVYILENNMRPTNFFTQDETAVLCAAMNAACMFHSTLCKPNGLDKQDLEKAAVSMPDFKVARGGDSKRSETTINGDSALWFLKAMYRALEKLADDPNCYQTSGIVANVDGIPVEDGKVQQCAVAFLERSFWEASCAGCKQYARLTGYYEVDLTDNERIRNYVARTIAILQDKLESYILFEKEFPQVCFCVDYAIYLRPLLPGTDLVMNGVEAGKFVESFYETPAGSSRGRRRRRRSNADRRQPQPVDEYFEQVRGRPDIEILTDIVSTVPYYQRYDEGRFLFYGWRCAE